MNFVTKQIFDFAKEHPLSMGTNMLLSLTFPVDDIVIPYLGGLIVTLVEKRKPWKGALLKYVVIMCCVQAFYLIGFQHDAVVFPQLQNYVRSGMLRDIIEHHSYGSLDGDMRIGELMSRVVKIPHITVDMYERCKNYLIPSILSFFCTSGYVMYRDFPIGMTMLIAGSIVILITSFSPYFCFKQGSLQESSQAVLDDETEDILRNISSVYTSNTTLSEMSRLGVYEEIYERCYWNSTLCSSYSKVICLVVLISMLLIFGYLIYTRVNSGLISSGLFVTIFMTVSAWYTSLGWMSSSIRTIVMEWGILSSHKKSIERTFDVLASPDVSDKMGDDVEIKVRSLEVMNLSYSIAGRPSGILRDVSFRVNRGDRVAIVGKVGSGKSTLLKILSRLKMPTSGDVLINNQSLFAMPLSKSRKLIGYVQQHPTLFNRSVYENIIYGVRNMDLYTKDVVGVLVDHLGLRDAFDNLKDGLDTLVGKGGSVLSGGQKQLVQMMRLFLMDPEIVVMDEVTSSLDEETKVKLLSLLRLLLDGKTTLMVTHDASLLSTASHVMEMRDGEVLSFVALKKD